MKKDLSRIFEIPEGLRLESVKEESGTTILFCRPKKQKVRCKFCGGMTVGYDHRVTNKTHTVISGKAVKLCITRRRVACKSCKKVFIEPIGGIPRSKFTDHFTQQVQEKSRGQDYTTVGREMGISCAAVSNRMSTLNIDLIKKIDIKKNPEKKG